MRARPWGQRRLVGLRIADQVTADRDQSLAPLRPKRRDDIGGPRTPVEPGAGRLPDPERIHQRDGVDREGGLLTVAGGLVRQEARRAVAAEIRHDHPVSRRSEQRDDVDKSVDVVWPAMSRMTVGPFGTPAST